MRLTTSSLFEDGPSSIPRRVLGIYCPNGQKVVTPGLSQPSPTKDNPDQIFDDLLKHNEVRSAKLREYSAVRTYALTDTQGKVQAKETVRMDYVAQTTTLS